MFCRQRGHSLKNCPKKSDESIDKKFCYNCGENGHSLAKCPKPLQDGNKLLLEKVQFFLTIAFNWHCFGFSLPMRVSSMSAMLLPVGWWNVLQIGLLLWTIIKMTNYKPSSRNKLIRSHLLVINILQKIWVENHFI